MKSTHIRNKEHRLNHCRFIFLDLMKFRPFSRLSEGHNTDGKYFITANRLAFHLVHSPTLVSNYIEKTKEGRKMPVSNVKIVQFACGKNHTVRIKRNEIERNTI